MGNGEQAAIALLPPAADSVKTYNLVRTRARLVAAWLATDFNNVVQGRIAKYDDTFNARAFGDAMKTFEQADPRAYESLPFNRGGAYDLLVMGGSVVIPGAGVTREDVAINFDDSVARTSGRIAEMGDLEGVTALDTVYFDGKFLHPAAATVRLRAGKGMIPIGFPAVFTVRETASPTSKVVGRVP